MKKYLLLAFFFTIPARFFSDVSLSGIFSDNMVLQQGKELNIWGFAGENEAVTVSFLDSKATVTAKDGTWAVKLPPVKAGGPFTLKISGKNTIELKNVLVGEVWFCSGQSNMGVTLSGSAEAADLIKIENPMIRFYKSPSALKAEAIAKPLEKAGSGWVLCTESGAKSFSAVAYYFGAELQKELKVPVGLILSFYSGSPVESWLSAEALGLSNDPGLNELYEKNPGEYLKKAEELKQKVQAARKQLAGKPKKKGEASSWTPSILYNSMVSPLIPYTLQGVIWYQGESNGSKAYDYRVKFPELIRSWRRDWGQGDFPFLFVQLAPWEITTDLAYGGIGTWPELRDSQLFTLKTVKNTAMAVTVDAGDRTNIHPTRKKPVGERLALAAKALAYGKAVEYMGPVYDKIDIKGGKAVISFTHTGSGLEAKDGALKGFSIAGSNKNFVPATAEIVENTVVVSSPEVTSPVAVRYGWNDYPEVNLWNKDGLPAGPFRTDNFTLTTQK